jgi:alpha-galactosidase
MDPPDQGLHNHRVLLNILEVDLGGSPSPAVREPAMVATARRFEPVAEVVCDPATTRVHEHGATSEDLAGPRPPTTTVTSTGLLAVELAPDGPALLWAGPRPAAELPVLRARPLPGRPFRLLVEADAEVAGLVCPSLAVALARWADGAAATAGVAAVPVLDPVWSPGPGAGEAAVLAGLDALDRLDLPAGVVMLGDGHQAAVGDWPARQAACLAGRIAGTGRRPGIWLAPLVVARRCRVAREHPDWLVEGAYAGCHRGEELALLDVGLPGPAAWIREVVASFAAAGFGFFELAHLAAGALPGRRRSGLAPLTAYREGLRLIREGAGPGAVLLASGALLLPAIGLADAVRVAPARPAPGAAAAAARRTAAARWFQHGRLWVNAAPGPGEGGADLPGGLVVATGRLDRLDLLEAERLRAALRPSSSNLGSVHMGKISDIRVG